MSLTRKIALHTGFQIGGKALGTVLSLAAVYFMTRYLGPAGYGQYTTVLAFLQFFGIIVDFGLYVVLLNRLARPNINREKLVSNVFTLRLLSAAIFLGLAPVIALLFPYDAIVKEGIALMALFYIFITLNQLLSAVFQKHLAMHWVAIAEIVGKVTLLLGVLGVIYLDIGLLWILGATLAGGTINFLIQFLSARRFEKIHLRFDKTLWKDIVLEAAPIAISISLNLIYFKADTIFLSLYWPQSEVGLYGAPYKVLEVLITFPAMFVGLVIPILSKAWAEKNLERFVHVLQKAVDFLLFLALPIVAGTIVTAAPIMELIGGAQFAGSAPILQLLIIAAGSIFIGTLFSYLIVVVNQQRSMVWGYLFVAATAVAGYLIFIPPYGGVAAASVTIYSEIAIALIAFWIVMRTTRARLSWKRGIKAMIAALAMAIIVDTLPFSNLFLLISIGAISYGVLAYGLRIIDRDMLAELFPKFVKKA